MNIHTFRCIFRSAFDYGVLPQTPLGTLRNMRYTHGITFLKSERKLKQIWFQQFRIKDLNAMNYKPLVELKQPNVTVEGLPILFLILEVLCLRLIWRVCLLVLYLKRRAYKKHSCNITYTVYERENVIWKPWMKRNWKRQTYVGGYY